MASIGSIIPSSNSGTTSGTSSGTTGSGATGAPASSKTVSAAADPLANESTFLTLLVSQLKNQNPMNPMDGTAFVTQLAQFSDLEQNLAMRQDLDTLTAKYAGTTPASDGGSPTGSGSTPGTSAPSSSSGKQS